VEEPKISFQSKETTSCPVCDLTFHREELLSGGGRLIAGKLTNELHRLYEPSVRYGEVHPLIYQATVCPRCWYASSSNDFALLPQEGQFTVSDDKNARIAETRLIFPDVDFSEGRTLESGTAALYLALRCYEHFPKGFSPTIKQGIAALRISWLLEELHKKNPEQHYDWLTMLFKKKAQYLYDKAIENEQSGKESLSGAKNLGPDIDKNYGYEGVLYISGILKLKYGVAGGEEQRRASLAITKRTIAKMFGLGRSSKNKPGPLLEHAKNLYDTINKELNETDD
jgi:uncharacterized protein (DUF2225 family)